MSKTQGDKVEDLALTYLQTKGAKLVTRNYRARGGEIDLILTLGETLIFAEVRYRAHNSFGSAAESVDWRKQQRLCQTAQQFLQSRPDLQDHPCRFDVLACRPNAASVDIQWIPNAFQP